MLNIFVIESFFLSIIVFEVIAKNCKICQKSSFKGNNSYKGSSDNFGHNKLLVDLLLLNIFATESFFLSIIIFEIIAKNCKIGKNSSFKGNNSYKGSSDDFGYPLFFVDLLLLNIFAIESFYLSIILFEIIAKNWKICQKSSFKGNNSWKTSSDNFDLNGTKVDLVILNIFASDRFPLSVTVFKI